MRKIMLLTPILASAALFLLAAQPAFAADAGTGTTFEISGGELLISAPVGPVSLGSGPASADAQAIGGSLGLVTVTDGRGGTAGWSTTALSTAFVAGTLSVPASAVSYVPGTATTTGSSVVTPASPTDLTTAAPVETADEVVGANSAAWNPTISIAVPVGTQTGIYSATLTHSVL